MIQNTFSMGAAAKDVAFSSDGRLFAVTLANNTVKVVETATGNTAKELVGHSSNVFAVDFGWDDKLVASASINETIRLWPKPKMSSN